MVRYNRLINHYEFLNFDKYKDSQYYDPSSSARDNVRAREDNVMVLSYSDCKLTKPGEIINKLEGMEKMRMTKGDGERCNGLKIRVGYGLGWLDRPEVYSGHVVSDFAVKELCAFLEDSDPSRDDLKYLEFFSLGFESDEAAAVIGGIMRPVPNWEDMCIAFKYCKLSEKSINEIRDGLISKNVGSFTMQDCCLRSGDFNRLFSDNDGSFMVRECWKRSDHFNQMFSDDLKKKAGSERINKKNPPSLVSQGTLL